MSRQQGISMLDYVNQYLTHKRGLGYKLGTESYLLRTFAEYADNQSLGQPLTVALAISWATAPQNASRLYHAKRLDAVRSFARYLATFVPGTQIPPGGILGPSYARITPHIYTDEEIAALITTAENLRPFAHRAKTNPLRNMTIIGLLACTGMRIGEALALEDRDVDLTQGIITIHRSKNLPMRLVPITESAVTHLRQYQVERDQCFGPVPATYAFFLSCYGEQLTHSSFFAAFDTIRKRAGLPLNPATGQPPRIHDLRHSFACRHLLRAYREGCDIDTAIHELSIYLGHASLRATYWYLTGIPILFDECMKRFEANAGQHGRGRTI